MTDPNDPPRLSTRPSSQLGGLMRGAQGDLPSQPELAALSLRLGATLGAGAAVAVVGKSTGLFAKIGVGALIAAGAVGVYVTAHHSHAPDSNGAVASAPQKPSTPASLIAAPPATAGEPSVPAAEPSAPVAAPSAPAAEPSSTEAPAAASKPVAPKVDEASLLERARRELGSNPAAALAISNEHLARFPGGALAEEREVIAIKALRQLGRTAEADRRAAAFAAKYPDSAHKRSVSSDSP